MRSDLLGIAFFAFPLFLAFVSIPLIFDFVIKPFDLAEIGLLVNPAYQIREMRREIGLLQHALGINENRREPYRNYFLASGGHSISTTDAANAVIEQMQAHCYVAELRD